MRALHPTKILTRVRARTASILALASVCVGATLVAACGGSVTSNSGGGTTTTAALSVVTPVVDCSKLAAIDITDIGGAGSSITSATVSAATVNGATVNFCTVKG